MEVQRMNQLAKKCIKWILIVACICMIAGLGIMAMAKIMGYA